MLLRKPFGFLIKYFKVIHLTLTAMIIYLLLKTNGIFRFIGEYMSSHINTIGTNISETLFTPLMLIMIIAVLIITLIILGLMSFKKKPIRFYIYTIFVYGFVAFDFIYSYSNIKTLETSLLDVRTLKLIQDFNLTALILQSISLIIVSIRATGFNIKKFDFDQDIEDLKITAEDNEEFEVDVELDTDQLKRNIRKKFRHAKYVYIENKFIIHMITLLIIAFICFLIYLNTGVYSKVYKQKEAFTTTEYMLNIQDSYITTTDYHNNKISDKKLVVIRYQVRSIYQVNKKLFKPSRFVLKIGGMHLNDTEVYKDSLYDLGNPYRNEYMTTSFQPYILVYEVPKDVTLDNMILEYTDINNKTIEVAIDPIYDEEKSKAEPYPLSQSLLLEKSILKNSQMQINSVEVSSVFTNYYTYCISVDNCYTGLEYIRPSTSDNYEKTLLKINGNFVLDETLVIAKITDLYTVLRDFGTIEYELNGETKTLKYNFKQVKPTKSTNEDTYYIEVPKEIENAEHIKILFTFREWIYEVVVK